MTTARVGFAEQFAAAFAVLARAKGFPSEVVVGYRVNPVAAARGIPIAVLPREIHAWVEVNLNGVGWVTFDPTNTTPRNSTVPSAPLPPPPATSGPRGDRQATDRAHTAPSCGARTAPAATGGLFLLLALLVASPAAVAGVKVLRRRRRARRGPPPHGWWAPGEKGVKPQVARRQGLPGHDRRRRRPGDRARRWVTTPPPG